MLSDVPIHVVKLFTTTKINTFKVSRETAATEVEVEEEEAASERRKKRRKNSTHIKLKPTKNIKAKLVSFNLSLLAHSRLVHSSVCVFFSNLLLFIIFFSLDFRFFIWKSILV